MTVAFTIFFFFIPSHCRNKKVTHKLLKIKIPHSYPKR